MWRRVERQLSRQGMDPRIYLQIQGKTREEMIEQARPDAEQALKREAVLEAVANAEDIEVTEEDMLEALQIPPGHEDHGHPEPADALAGDPRVGPRGAPQEDLRMRRALELIAEQANPIPLEQAKAREEIWTPEKEQRGEGAALDARLRLADALPTGYCQRSAGAGRRSRRSMQVIVDRFAARCSPCSAYGSIARALELRKLRRTMRVSRFNPRGGDGQAGSRPAKFGPERRPA